jgi:hypothetical protein
LRDIASSQNGIKGLEALSRILSMGVQGPAKLVLQWNQSQLKAWRKLNKSTVEIGRSVVCKDIALAGATADNPQFFQELSEARGCDD